MFESQRKLFNKMSCPEEFDEHLITNYLSPVDIEELKLREKQLKKFDLGKKKQSLI